MPLRRHRGSLESDHICISIEEACQLSGDILDTLGKQMHKHVKAAGHFPQVPPTSRLEVIHSQCSLVPSVVLYPGL